MNEVLRQWLANNMDRLKAKHVEVDARVLDDVDDYPDGGGAIGFIFENVILEILFWDRRPYEVSVMVVDADADADLFSKDSSVETLGGVIALLDQEVDNLLSGKYKDMTRDSKPLDL